MNKCLSFLLIVLIFASCDNELDLVEDFKDIPIVYGLIDNAAETQYIRVERAFIDKNTSALEIAQIPDSLYYKDAIVELYVPSLDESFPLTMIDGNLEGIQREDGVFATDPNYLYKIESNTELPILEGEQYDLRIIRAGDLPVVTASTTMLSNPFVQRPQEFGTIDWDYIQPTPFTWLPADENSSIFDIIITVNYRERNVQEGTAFVEKSVDWKMLTNYTIPSTSLGQTVKVEIAGIEFFGFLRGSLEVNPALERRFTNLEFKLFSGGVDLQEFIAVGQANLGITSSQDIPTYTNLSEGRGLFSSINVARAGGIDISPDSKDSLANSIITKDLNFVF